MEQSILSQVLLVFSVQVDQAVQPPPLPPVQLAVILEREQQPVFPVRREVVVLLLLLRLLPVLLD